MAGEEMQQWKTHDAENYGTCYNHSEKQLASSIHKVEDAQT